MNEYGELRAISGHVLGASGVQIPLNNLDNLQSIREEEDGAIEVSDPQDVLGSILLAVIDFATLGFDPLALVEGFTPVEDNRGEEANWSVIGCKACLSVSSRGGTKRPLDHFVLKSFFIDSLPQASKSLQNQQLKSHWFP
ncbi:hypothetical protein Tco_1228899 [Tanacetum coccineum]